VRINPTTNHLDPTMKLILTTIFAAFALAPSVFADDCGKCKGGKKDKEEVTLIAKCKKKECEDDAALAKCKKKEECEDDAALV